MIAGRVFAFWILLVFVVAILYQVQRAQRQQTSIQIRPIGALDALEEAIGRATEMGRPVHFSSGVGDVAAGAADVLAGLEVLSHVARRTAELDTRLVATVAQPSTYVVTEEVVRTAYAQAGRPEQYESDMVRFLSPNQWAYASGVVGVLNREKCAANIIVGAFAAEAMLIAEAGHLAGAIQVAGTTNMFQLPFFIAACDYTLIGEEMYASAAYFSRDPVHLGTLSGEDLGKAIGLMILVVGVVLTAGGSQWLVNLMRK